MSIPKKSLFDKVSVPNGAKKLAAAPLKGSQFSVSVEVGHVGVGQSHVDLGKGDPGEYQRYLAAREESPGQRSLLAKLAGWLGLK